MDTSNPMTYEKALVSRAPFLMIAARLREAVKREMMKGCTADLHPQPVALEPVYTPLNLRDPILIGPDAATAIPEEPINPRQWVRRRIWISPKHRFSWDRAELFVRMLAGVSRRVAFEVLGNCSEVSMQLACHLDDLGRVNAACTGQFSDVFMGSSGEDRLAKITDFQWSDVQFRDYFAPRCYADLFTPPQSLKVSPIEPIIIALHRIPLFAYGIYQIAFQPVSPAHAWHQNVSALQDLIYQDRLLSGIQPAARGAQQSPSGDLRHMAENLESKAAGDLPFFSVAMRLGVFGAGHDGRSILAELDAMTHLFQHGGSSLRFLEHTDYLHLQRPFDFSNLFTRALTWRPGFLLNARELSGVVQFPGVQFIRDRSITFETLNPLPHSASHDTDGSPVGSSDFAGQQTPVKIPLPYRDSHVHLFGNSGMGKSTTLETMILDDIRRGCGVMVLDPHGDLIDRLLRLIPEESAHRVIYFNPCGMNDLIPIWNPLDPEGLKMTGRFSGDMVGVFKGIMGPSWGGRIESLLRNIFYSLGKLPNSTLMDAYTLLRSASPESQQIQSEILSLVENENVRQFWLHDFKRCRNDDLAPPRHLLSKILVTDTVSYMLSQPNSLFTLRDVMNGDGILLADLSGVSEPECNVLGSMLIGLSFHAALARSDVSRVPREMRRPTRVYCDEVQRFVTDSLEHMLSEARKFRVGLTLSHVRLEQLTKDKRGALFGVGTTLVFNVNLDDAGRIANQFRGEVDTDDLVNLQIGEAYFRSGLSIAKIRTPGPLTLKPIEHRERILAESFRKYYRRTGEVRNAIAERRRRWTSAYTPLSTAADPDTPPPTEFEYDEFS